MKNRSWVGKITVVSSKRLSAIVTVSWQDTTPHHSGRSAHILLVENRECNQPVYAVVLLGDLLFRLFPKRWPVVNMTLAGLSWAFCIDNHVLARTDNDHNTGRKKWPQNLR